MLYDLYRTVKPEVQDRRPCKRQAHKRYSALLYAEMAQESLASKAWLAEMNSWKPTKCQICRLKLFVSSKQAWQIVGRHSVRYNLILYTAVDLNLIDRLLVYTKDMV
jgi:hypothetical protein